MELIRKRIIELLDEAFDKKKVVLLIAPIGYGKTTVAKQFFAEKKATYLDNTFYGDMVTKEDYDDMMERFRQQFSVSHIDWKGDTKRLGEFLKDKYDYSLHDNIEHLKYVPIMIERSNIYLQQKNVMKSIVCARGCTYLKFDELEAKGTAVIIDKTILAFTKAEVAEFAKINDIAISSEDLKYCVGELKGVPLLVSMYLNGGAARRYKPYLSVYKSAHYDAKDSKTQEILQLLAMFGTFTLQEARSVCDSDLVDKAVDDGHKYEGILDFDIGSLRYKVDDFFQELAEGLTGRQIYEKYGDAIIAIKLKSGEYERALDLTYKCHGRAAALELFNGDLYTLEIPMRYEAFGGCIARFTAEEKVAYPYAYLKYAFAELFNGGSEALRREFISFYNSIVAPDCNLVDKDTLLQNCHLIMLLSGMIDGAKFRSIMTPKSTFQTIIKVVNMDKLFKQSYIIMSLRNYASVGNLHEFYTKNIFELQAYFGMTDDVYNQLYSAENDLIVGKWHSAKEKLELVVAKAGIMQNYELLINSVLMLARASYFAKSTERMSSFAYEIDKIKLMSVVPQYLSDTASQYIKQYLGRNNGYMVSAESVFYNRMLNNYGSFYVMNYIMKCFVAEERFDELKIYLTLCADKSAVRAIRSDESLILLYRAILENSLGKTDFAIKELIKCVNLCAMDGILDILVDESKNIMSLLAIIEKHYIDEIREVRYFEKLIEICQDFAMWQNIRSDKLLSAREREILRYMGKNLKRKAIAEIMYLSPETVKKYMQSLYKKLGANNYTQAILNATKFNLI